MIGVIRVSTLHIGQIKTQSRGDVISIMKDRGDAECYHLNLRLSTKIG